jgi:hypothetical protein
MMKTTLLSLVFSLIGTTALAHNGYGSHGVDKPYGFFNQHGVQAITTGNLMIDVVSQNPTLRLTCSEMSRSTCGFFTQQSGFLVIEQNHPIELTF